MTTEKSMSTLPPYWVLVLALKEESDDHSASWKTLCSNLVVREPQCTHSILSIGQKISYLRRNERLAASSLLPTLFRKLHTRHSIKTQADFCLSRTERYGRFSCTGLHVHPPRLELLCLVRF